MSDELFRERILNEYVLVIALIPTNIKHVAFMFRKYRPVLQSLLHHYPIIVYSLKPSGGLVVIPERFIDIWEVFLKNILCFEVHVLRKETLKEHIIDAIETEKFIMRLREGSPLYMFVYVFI